MVEAPSIPGEGLSPTATFTTRMTRRGPGHSPQGMQRSDSGNQPKKSLLQLPNHTGSDHHTDARTYVEHNTPQDAAKYLPCAILLIFPNSFTVITPHFRDEETETQKVRVT